MLLHVALFANMSGWYRGFGHAYTYVVDTHAFGIWIARTGLRFA